MSTAPDTTAAVAQGQGAPVSPAGTPSPWRRVVSAMRSTPSVVICAILLGLIVLMAVFAPVLAKITGWGPYDFDASSIDSNLGGLPIGAGGGISSTHWFGVEPGNGRDLFIRIAYGARVSLLIALGATLVTTVVGVVLGMLAGYFGGWVDTVVSRVMDFLMAFPSLIFMIAILSVLPSGDRPVLLVVVLSIFGWPYTARVVRGQTMSLRNAEFVEAAKASGAGPLTIAFKEVLPNLRGTIIVLATIAVPSYIGTEAGLSFLGVGVAPPTPSWGQMISQAVGWYAVDPMYFIFPGLFLFLTVLAFTVIGDRLKQELDEGGAS